MAAMGLRFRRFGWPALLVIAAVVAAFLAAAAAFVYG
jgi:hypothetical protein